MARTKPGFHLPAVTSTIYVTAALSAADADGHLDAPTVTALNSTLGTVDADLNLRHDYAHGHQLGLSAENWKGRRPADGNEADFIGMLVTDDQLGPAMSREVDAQFAKDPEWDATDNGTKLDADAELVQNLTDWHGEGNLNGAAKDAARARWWAGRMVGRVYVPEEYREQLTGPNAPVTLDDALQLVHVQAVDPREGGPILDRHCRCLGYWYRYERSEGSESQQVMEIHTPRYVLTYLQDRTGKLTLENEADSPFHNPAQPQRARRAEYLMWHADRDGGSSITGSVKDAQDRLNVVTTYMGRNDDQTGYRQIIVANAEQFKDKAGNPVPFPMGPGVAVNLRGLPKTDPNDPAKKDRHTPTWEVIEPLNPEVFHVPSTKYWKTSILEKLDQLWTLSPEVTVSGESKRQSRKPFDRRASFAGQDVGAFVAWALRAALMLASQIIGTRDHQGVTFVPKVFLDVDAVNLEELRLKLAMWESGALTLVSLLESVPGVGDAAKEAEAVAKEPKPAASPPPAEATQ